MAHKIVLINTNFFAIVSLFYLPQIQQVANLLLLIQCVLTMYIQWSLEEKLDRLAPSLVFSLLLLCRYFVHFQATEKERRIAQARKVE